MDRPTIALCVEPRLFSDSLAGGLSKRGIDVTVVRGDPEGPPGSFDIAVTTGELPAGVSAGLVLHIQDPDGADVRPHEPGVPVVQVAGLAEIVTTIDDWNRVAG